MANPRKFSEKIALHNQKQAEETAAFEKIMQEVSAATNKVNSSVRQSRASKAPPETVSTESSLRPTQQLGTYRSGSLPNVAAPQATNVEPENKPEENTLAAQYGMGGGHSGGTSPSRVPGQRGRASSSGGPMRTRPAERKHDTSPYGSSVYLSPPPQDSSWRRTNSDSALHQTCGEQQAGAALSPHHPLHSHAHPHLPQHQTHRRADIHMDALTTMGVNVNNRPRSSCEIPRIPNNSNVTNSSSHYYSVYESGGGGGTLSCGDLQMPGGSLPDLTSVHYPPQHSPYVALPHRTSPSTHYHHQSPTSPGGSASPATGGLSPASGSPVGATVPAVPAVPSGPPGPSGPSAAAVAAPLLDVAHAVSSTLYEQNHLSVPNTNNYLHRNKNMSPLEHSWMTNYQPPCSPPSQYSSTSNINIPSPTMVHSPGSPAESPQTEYLQTELLQPLFESFTMMDNPTTNYNAPYINHSSPHSPQPTNSPHTYSSSPQRSSPGMERRGCGGGGGTGAPRTERDPVPGGNGPVFPAGLPVYAAQDTPIPDIILTDYSSEQIRADLDLDDLSLLDEPSALLPDSSVEHEFRLDRL